MSGTGPVPGTYVPAGERMSDRFGAIVVALTAAASFATLLLLGRDLTFFADEWTVIAARGIEAGSFLEPFNEHWLGVAIVVYLFVVEAVGLTSYLPYLALLAALHVVVAVEVWVLVRRRTVPLVAAVVAVIVLFLGSGFENLFWAMQIGFVGAVAFGFGAMLLLDGPGRPWTGRVVAAAALLALAVMTSGYGLFVLAFVALDVLLDPRRRSLFVAAVVPAAIYLAWYVTYGQAGVGRIAEPFSLEALLRVPGFVLGGVSVAFGSATGVGQTAGVLVAVAALAWIVRLAATGRPVPSRALAAFGAMVAMNVLLALVRSQLDVDASLYTRYTYLSAMLALIGLAALIGRPRMPTARLPRLGVLAAGGLVVALSLGWNLLLLVKGRDLFEQRADLTRALVELALQEPLPAGVDPDLHLVLVPSPARLREVVDRHGSPLGAPIPEEARAEALRRARDHEALRAAPENAGR